MFVKIINVVHNAKGRHVGVMGAVLVLILSTFSPTSFTQSGRTIDTVAGTGVCGFSGDGSSAGRAQLKSPNGLATDLAGNLYIADLGNHVVRKVTSFGTISTVAGTGAPGYNGDNKLSTNAQLAAPTAVATDPSGRNLYIVDNGNHAIRRVDLQTSAITTIAGVPQQPGFEGDGGLATNAKFRFPSAMVVDSLGNIYVADARNFRVRRIDITTGVITTVAGNGARGDSGDGGNAVNASFKGISALAMSRTGDLFVADNEAHRVRKVSGGVVTGFAGNGSFVPPTPGGPALASSIKWPQGLASDFDGSLFISDNASHMVFRVSPTGMLSIITGSGGPGFSGDEGPAESAMVNGPSGLAVDHFGNIFLSDTLNCRVRRVAR